jgi:site-specific DNA-methyltransferase (adenine-specific)
MKDLKREVNRAPLNRTIELTSNDIEKYTKQLLSLENNTSLDELDNRIIWQDIDEAINYLPDKFIDLMFIDPPYNINKKFNKHSFKSMSGNEYEKWFQSWFSKMIRILKDNASVYICSDWTSSSAIVNVATKHLKLQNRITWEREKGRGAKRNWKNCAEDIWFFTKSGTYTFNVEKVKLRRKVLAPYKDESGAPKDWKSEGNNNYRDTAPSNLWTDISVPFWSMSENTDHPTQKPEKLLAKIILASSNTDDIVFDPFLGSGTTAVVAKKLGRKFVGVEKDQYYCCLSCKRLDAAKLNNHIQGYSNGVFWERNTLRDQLKKIKE